jgi:hypothetical protein
VESASRFRMQPSSPRSRRVSPLFCCTLNVGLRKGVRQTGCEKVLRGDAQIPIKLTPVIEKESTELQLQPEVGEIQADGSLGEILRSGALGDAIREKVRTSILNALQKGTSLAATLPPAVQGCHHSEC